MTETIHIYTLSDETGVRYVGQTNDPSVRLSSHKCNGGRGRDKTKRGQWIKGLMDKGQTPVLTVIEKCPGSLSNEREQYWVNHYLEQGVNLLNMPVGRSAEPNTNIVLTDNELTFIQERYGGQKSYAIHAALKLLMDQVT